MTPLQEMIAEERARFRRRSTRLAAFFGGLVAFGWITGGVPYKTDEIVCCLFAHMGFLLAVMVAWRS